MKESSSTASHPQWRIVDHGVLRKPPKYRRTVGLRVRTTSPAIYQVIKVVVLNGVWAAPDQGRSAARARIRMHPGPFPGAWAFRVECIARPHRGEHFGDRPQPRILVRYDSRPNAHDVPMSHRAVNRGLSRADNPVTGHCVSFQLSTVCPHLWLSKRRRSFIAPPTRYVRHDDDLCINSLFSVFPY